MTHQVYDVVFCHYSSNQRERELREKTSISVRKREEDESVHCGTGENGAKEGGRERERRMTFIVIVKAKRLTLSDCYHHLCKAHI